MNLHGLHTHSNIKKVETKKNFFHLNRNKTENKNFLVLPSVPLHHPLSLSKPQSLFLSSRRDPLRRLPDPRLHQRPEVPDEPLDGPGRGVAERADGVPLDLLGDLFRFYFEREREREKVERFFVAVASVVLSPKKVKINLFLLPPTACRSPRASRLPTASAASESRASPSPRGRECTARTTRACRSTTGERSRR